MEEVTIQKYKNSILISGSPTKTHKDKLKECDCLYNSTLKGWICKIENKKNMIEKMSQVVKIVEVSEKMPELDILRDEIKEKDKTISQLKGMLKMCMKELKKPNEMIDEIDNL